MLERASIMSVFCRSGSELGTSGDCFWWSVCPSGCAVPDKHPLPAGLLLRWLPCLCPGDTATCQKAKSVTLPLVSKPEMQKEEREGKVYAVTLGASVCNGNLGEKVADLFRAGYAGRWPLPTLTRHAGLG